MEEAAELNRKKFVAEEGFTSSMSSFPPISFRLSPLLGLAKGFFKRGLLVFFLGNAASFPVVLGEIGCDVNCQAFSLIARTGLGRGWWLCRVAL